MSFEIGVKREISRQTFFTPDIDSIFLLNQRFNAICVLVPIERYVLHYILENETLVFINICYGRSELFVLSRPFLVLQTDLAV